MEKLESYKDSFGYWVSIETKFYMEHIKPFFLNNSMLYYACTI